MLIDYSGWSFGVANLTSGPQIFFLKIAQAELGAWDLLDFVYFLCHKQLTLYHTATVPPGLLKWDAFGGYWMYSKKFASSTVFRWQQPKYSNLAYVVENNYN